MSFIYSDGIQLNPGRSIIARLRGLSDGALLMILSGFAVLPYLGIRPDQNPTTANDHNPVDARE